MTRRGFVHAGRAGRHAPGPGMLSLLVLLGGLWGLHIVFAKAIGAEDAATLQSFADPKYQGRVSIGDNVDDAYALAFLATGVKDWSNVTDEQFEAATEFLRKVHPNVVSCWQDANQLVQMMGSGQVVLSWAWNDGAARLQSEGYPVEFKRDTEEGSSTWVCGLVRLKGGSAPEEKVYDFIDAWLAPATSDYLVNA